LGAILQFRLPSHIGITDKISFGIKFTDQGFPRSNGDLLNAGFIKREKELQQTPDAIVVCNQQDPFPLFESRGNFFLPARNETALSMLETFCQREILRV